MKLLRIVFFIASAFCMTDATFPIIAEKLMDLAEGLVNKTRNFVKLSQIDDKEVDKFIQGQEAKSQQNNNQEAASGLRATVNLPRIPKPVENVGSSLDLSTNVPTGIGKGPKSASELNLNVYKKLGQLPHLDPASGLTKSVEMNIPKPALNIGSSTPTVVNITTVKIPQTQAQLNLNTTQKVQKSNLNVAPGLTKSVQINIPKPALNIGSSISSAANVSTAKELETQGQSNLNTFQKVQPTNLNVAPGLMKSVQINVPAIPKPDLNIGSSVNLITNTAAVKGNLPTQLNLNASQTLDQSANLNATPGLSKSIQIYVPAIPKPLLNIGSSVDLSANAANGIQVPAQLNSNESQSLGQPTNSLPTNLATSPIEKGATSSTSYNTVNVAKQPLNTTGA